MSPPLELPHNIRPHQRGSILTCPPKVTPGCLPPQRPSSPPSLPVFLLGRWAPLSSLSVPPLLHPSFFTIRYSSRQTSSKEAKQRVQPSLQPLLSLWPSGPRSLYRELLAPWHLPVLAWHRPGGSRSASLVLRVPGEWSFLQMPLGAFGLLA